jgi:hypothetical protein
MARVDRRVSPNQLALWTVHELRDMWARRVLVSRNAGRPRGHGPVRRAGRRMLDEAARVVGRAVNLVRVLAGQSLGFCPVTVP